MCEGKEAEQVPVTVRVKVRVRVRVRVGPDRATPGDHHGVHETKGSADPQGLGVGGVSRFEWRSVT